MMSAPEIILRQDRVGLSSEIAVSKEQQLNPLPHLVIGRGWCESQGIYVSHIDLS
jgi:hypothetical protein